MQEPFDAMEAAFQQSWEVHRQAFGPILEPAFTDNIPARIHLTNALNHISRRNIQRGMELLKEIQPMCVCNADKAAWAFFVGLCFEMGGAQKQMLQWYEKAGKLHHHFYLPYLKLARAAHQASDLQTARAYYETAIACLLEMEDTEEIILGSVYTNLCSCLVMLHDYAPAEEAWKAAQAYPQQPGTSATGAILYAALGKPELVKPLLKALKKEAPTMVPLIRDMTEQILAGTHPEFQKD